MIKLVTINGRKQWVKIEHGKFASYITAEQKIILLLNFVVYMAFFVMGFITGMSLT